jgi:hypothetical protein
VFFNAMLSLSQGSLPSMEEPRQKQKRSSQHSGTAMRAISSLMMKNPWDGDEKRHGGLVFKVD